MSQSRLETWRRWLEQIRLEVHAMYLRRDVFNRVGRMLRESELPPSYYWQYMRDTYAATQALAVRRQADRRKDTVCLRRLLSDMRENPSYMTREAFLELWPDDEHDQRYAGRQFDEDFAGKIGKHLDPAVPSADMRALDEAAASVKAYADEYLAHSADVEGRTDLPTFDDISAAVDEIGGQFHTYMRLLTAKDQVLLPILPAHWYAIFTKRWLPPGSDEIMRQTPEEIIAGRRLRNA